MNIANIKIRKKSWIDLIRCNNCMEAKLYIHICFHYKEATLQLSLAWMWFKKTKFKWINIYEHGDV